MCVAEAKRGEGRGGEGRGGKGEESTNPHPQLHYYSLWSHQNYTSVHSLIIFLSLFMAFVLMSRIEEAENNFPEMFIKMFTSQAVEIARQCVTPPLKHNPR